MSAIDADVTLVTAERFLAPGAPGSLAAHVAAEDRVIAEGLAALGLTSRRVAWSDESVDFSRTRVVLLRATWDYFERLGEFTTWLDRVERSATLVNAPDLVRWNLDKRYLAALAGSGIPVPPTRFVARGAQTTLRNILEETGWREVVVKPAVSASGWETHRVADVDTFEVKFQRLLRRRGVLVQPCLRAIAEHGEISCVLIDGHLTHAVRKLPGEGGFLVQAEHGGTTHAHAATEEQRQLAQDTLAALPRQPAYARVDLVPGDNGRWWVGELELIEPELWLLTHPEAAARLVEAVAQSARPRSLQ